MPPNDQPKLLEYSPRPPWHRRRWVGRMVLILTLALAILLGQHIWPYAQRQAMLLRLQAGCLNYTAPPGTEAKFVPQVWSDFYAMLSPPGISSNGTAFLHERISPGGNRRLVAVDLVNRNSVTPANDLLPRTFIPGTPLKAPVEALVPSRALSLSLFAGIPVLAGQADPKDPSHFTIEIKANPVLTTGPYVIDGWLKDDDTVLLEVRSSMYSGPMPSDGVE